MALVVKDRVQETTTTTGTGTITLAGAVTGFQSFSVIGDANTTYYTIAAGSQWEVGIGTYTSSGTTLSRDTILESSTGGTAVDFSAGIKNVFVTYPAEKSLYLDANNNAIGLGTVATTTTLTNATGLPLTSGVTGTLPVANGGTGATTQTAYAVLAGGTTATGAYQSIASVGTAGQVLTSNGAGALPTFQAAGGGFASGTVMLFAQTSAPTGWTKNTTTGDNNALRVVTGTVGSGGSVDFTTAFASQTPTGSVAISTISGSAGATTLTTPQIPSHAHRLLVNPGGAPNTNKITMGNAFNTFVNTPGYSTRYATGPSAPGGGNQGSDNTGGGGDHTHPFSFSSGSGTFSGNAINLAVKYVDVIRATKD
jgi:hypothetical protein